MMPRALYRLPVLEAVRLTLAVLYDDVEDPESVRAWEDGRSAAPPFIWRLSGYQALGEALGGRARSAVAKDLSTLMSRGIIRRARRDGRTGLELLGTRAVDPSANRTADRTRTAGPKVRHDGPDSPASPIGQSATTDRKVRHDGLKSPKRLTPESVTTDFPPDRTVRHRGPDSPSPRTPGSVTTDPTRARAVTTLEAPEEKRATPTPTRRGEASAANVPPKRQEKPLASPAMQAPARALLLQLAHEFGELFVPTTAEGTPLESRRIRPDTETLRRLADLLTPPEDVDAETWIAREVERVRAYVRDYATICKADPEQARAWGSRMLESQTTAWETTQRIVDRWREAEAAARRAEREAQAAAREADRRAVAERLAELEQLARRGETPGERDARVGMGLAARDHRADHAAAQAAQKAATAAGRPLTLAELNAAVRAAPAPAPTAATPLPELPAMQRAEPGRPPLTDAASGRPQRAGITDEQALTRLRLAIAEFRRVARRDPNTSEMKQIEAAASGKETGT